MIRRSIWEVFYRLGRPYSPEYYQALRTKNEAVSAFGKRNGLTPLTALGLVYFSITYAALPAAVTVAFTASSDLIYQIPWGVSASLSSRSVITYSSRSSTWSRLL